MQANKYFDTKRVKMTVGRENEAYDVNGENPLPVGNNVARLRDEFAGPALDPSKWELVQTGSGMAVTVGNGITSSYLNIASGTTINSETIIRSRQIFNIPTRFAAFLSASQRIVNQEFFVELIEVDDNGNPINVAASQPNAGNLRNHVSLKLDGTTATNAVVTVRGSGAPEIVSATTTITTTAASGSSPNWTPAGIVELQVSAEHILLMQAVVDSSSAASALRRITQMCVDPNTRYRLQIRARNLGTAPASSTDWRVHSIREFEYTQHTVEVLGGPGHSSPGAAIPVTMTGGSSTVSGALAHALTASSVNPVLISAESRTSLGTATTSGQNTRLMATTVGAMVTKPHAIQEAAWNFTASVTATTDTPVQAAAGVGLRRHVIGGNALNTGASAVDLNIRDGTTTRLTFTLPPNVPVSFDLDGMLQVTANTALNVSLSAAGTVRVNLWGYTAP